MKIMLYNDLMPSRNRVSASLRKNLQMVNITSTKCQMKKKTTNLKSSLAVAVLYHQMLLSIFCGMNG